MKTYKILLLFTLTLFFNCSLGNDNTTNSVPKTNITWHLTQTTGGIEGVNDQFELGTVVWTFYESTGVLYVDNQNTDTTKEAFLSSGNYTYSINQVGGLKFITIDGVEYGEIIINTNDFTINENNKSTGTESDGFVYTFQKVVEQL
ncbi:hypothetical protein [Gaetbulibacter aestuarii]|uniref:Lipocalin-like domain-containing protein n=1 Tax=Gaetbulibacter aestuarii TaxID=1502358 RepID=A0ABW7MYB4_9FLAO